MVPLRHLVQPRIWKSDRVNGFLLIGLAEAWRACAVETRQSKAEAE